ncbi:MAG: DegT/DnrJ/EryC1/StrS family aminotransferase [Deltaproteobacteria bacterium]|nr:DegT/DnrJ/EryC1/StrS family aminotransferase [Deltaproteobacteria bacterium]
MNKRIRLADLAAQYAKLAADIDAAVARVLASGRYVNGPETEAFEREFAAFTGAAHAVAVSNGTDALALLLAAHGVGPGDDVVLPANTFRATAEAVHFVGARPVLCDVNADTLLVDGASVARAATPQMRAVMAVHLFGYLAPVGDIADAAEGAIVLEDAAQAHGALLNGRHAGTLAQGGAFSFFPAKSLGAAGDAGAILFDDELLAAKARSLRNHGRGTHETLGRNARMDEIQAAILRVKLPHLRSWIDRRRAIEKTYRDAFAGREDIRFLPAIAGTTPAPLNTVIRCTDRDAVARTLAENGVETGVHYPVPIHLLEPYRALGYAAGDFPNAEAACREILSLPNHPQMTDEDVDRVIAALS